MNARANPEVEFSELTAVGCMEPVERARNPI
jgi:hypothetical protein